MSDPVMSATQFVETAQKIAQQPSLYVMGAFGAPSTSTSRARYTGPNANPYNQQTERKNMILSSQTGTWFFDCIGLIKGILWGFRFDLAATYGGAIYESNGVPDSDADTYIGLCTDVSTDFTNVQPGEMLWKSGHAGIYIGAQLAVECTPAFANRVQVTSVQNMGNVTYPARTWTKHGKLPFVDYTQMPFTDVRGAENRAAVQWAWENGITQGTSATTFSPNNPCTRIQIVKFLKRFYDQFIA